MLADSGSGCSFPGVCVCVCVTAAALICTEGSTCVWGSCETSDTSFLQVQKIISHFQALLFSHSGCLFFTKARRIEVDNKPSICQSENEFLNAERHFGILKSICHRQNILSLTLFLRCRFPCSLSNTSTVVSVKV